MGHFNNTEGLFCHSEQKDQKMQTSSDALGKVREAFTF